MSAALFMKDPRNIPGVLHIRYGDLVPKIVDHEQRRSEIVDALWRVVERDGAQAVSVRSVAAEAGMSKTGMSHYFASQSELLAVAVEQTIASVTEESSAFDLTNVTPELATQALLLLIPSGSERRQRAQVWLAVLSASTDDPASAQVLDRLNKETRGGITRVIEGLRASGHLGEGRDIEQVAATTHALVDGLSLQTVTDETLLGPDAAAELVRAFVASLAK